MKPVEIRFSERMCCDFSQPETHMNYIKSFLMMMALVLCLGAGTQAAGSFFCTTVYAAPAAEEEQAEATETEKESDGLKLTVFMVVILFVCIVAVIVAVSSVTVSLPIIEFFE